MQHPGGLRLAVSAVLLASAATTMAQTGSEPARFALEEVVVTATRVATPAFDVPAMIHTLTATDIQGLNQSRTLPESLSEVPGVMVQKTGHGQGSPYIRGYTGFRNVMLIDGIRLNNSVFRDGANQYWATVDSYSVERIEVLKGPASVLYGSDAIGGTVNVLSGLPSYAGDGFTPRVQLRVSDAEDSTTGRAEAIWKGEKLRALAGYTYRDYGDLSGGRDVGTQPKTGYDEDAANARIEYDLSEATQLVLGYQYLMQEDAWRTHRTVHGLLWEGTVRGNDFELSFDQRRHLGYLQLDHQGLGALADNLKLSLSYQEQSEDNFRIRNNLRTDRLGFDVGTTGFWAQFDKQVGDVQLVYGADWYRDDVDSHNYQFNANGSVRAIAVQGPVADDSTYDLGGVYLQGLWQATPRVGVSLAGRYTYAEVDAGRVADPLIANREYSFADDWDNFSGSARVSFTPVTDGPWMIYGGVSQAFRAPNLSDLTRLDTARSNELEVPSPGLSPEEFLSYELGLKYANERLGVQLAYFDTEGEDVIIRTPTGRKIGALTEVTKVNAGESNVHGVELQLSYAIVPELIAYADGVWIDGEADAFPTTQLVSVTEPLDVMMPLSWRAGLRWTGWDDRLQLNAVVEHSDTQDELSTRDVQDTQRIPPGGTPSFTVLHLRSQWQITDVLSLSIAIENLTDADYRIHGSGVNESGRNFIASISWAP